MGPNRESGNLDLLRALAVLFVYFGHLLQTLAVLDMDSKLGAAIVFFVPKTGVLIFFVHTSLVLMMSMERLSLRGWRLFAAFYTRRAFRIYPLAIVVVLGLAACQIPAYPTDLYARPGWYALLSNMTLTQNLTGAPSFPAVLWSLPFEVQMYMTLPLIFVLLRALPSRWTPLALWCAAAAGVGAAIRWGPESVSALLIYVPSFLGGVVAYRLWNPAGAKLSYWGWPAAILAGTAVRCAVESGTHGATILSEWALCLFLGLLAPYFRDLPSGWVRRGAGWIARYSYGIYLTHTAALWIAFEYLTDRPFWMQIAVCAVLSVALPLPLYHWIEKPMIGVGARLGRALGRTGSITGQAIGASAR